MRRRRRTLRERLSEARLSPEERAAARAERCMETLFDAERAPAVLYGEREQAALEAERRRWAHLGPPAAPRGP
jgi:hypothetical protein